MFLFLRSDKKGKVYIKLKSLKGLMKHIPVHKISFERADGYVCTEQDVLEIELRRLGLYGTAFAYSAFKPKLLATVLKTGTPHINTAYPNSIDCCIVDSPIATIKTEIRDNDEYDLAYYLAITSDGKIACFAVYDKSKMEPRKEDHPYYRFKEPDKKLEALLAVVEVNLSVLAKN